MTEVIKVEDCGSNIGDYYIPIHNAIIIPEGATNGDMIKALFPNFKINEEWKATRHFELQSDSEHIEITGIATREWWNAPYKAESEDK